MSDLIFSRYEVEEASWFPVAKIFSRQSRWETWWWIVFEHDGKLVRVEYNYGSTEVQECDWPEVFEGEVVEPVTVERVEYRVVDK